VAHYDNNVKIGRERIVLLSLLINQCPSISSHLICALCSLGRFGVSALVGLKMGK